jgi:hypothetical protein
VVLISNLTLSIEDGSTIASTDIYTAGKTYINIGSGNVFKLTWNALNDTVDHYNLVIKRHDTVLNVYYDIYDKNVGLVNKFYVDSSLLPIIPEQYKLSVYIVAHNKNGSVITSNVITPYICKGSGTYVKVKEKDYNESIMKRALAFAKVDASSDTTARIIDQDGNEVSLLAGDGSQVQIPVAWKLENGSGWEVMQEGHVKGTDGVWHANDIKNEVLQVYNNDTEKYEVLKDRTGELIYVL